MARRFHSQWAPFDPLVKLNADDPSQNVAGPIPRLAVQIAV